MRKLKIPKYILWLLQTGLVFVALMSLLRWLLVLIFRTPSEKLISLKQAYLLGLRYDVRHVCIVLLLILLLSCIPALHPINKKWGRRIALYIWAIFIIIMCVFYAVDFGNYAYLHQRVNASVLTYLQDAKISFGMMWQSYHMGWNLLGLIGAALLLFGIVKINYNIVLSYKNTATQTSKIIWNIIFFFVFAYLIVGRIVVKSGQYPLRWSDAFSLGNDYAANIALNPFQSFFSSFSFKDATYDEKKVKEHYYWMSEYLGVDGAKRDTVHFNFERTFPIVETKPYNVVLVICESFSAYKSSMYGNPLNTTPYFANLCKQGAFFNRAFSPAYGTARGVWAIVTGIPDVQFSKTSSRNPAAVNQHTLINDFAEHDKFYFLGGSSTWANIRGLLTNNIENLHLYEQGSYGSDEVDVWGISDKNLFLEANKILSKQQKPFFAVIQTADNHRPYTIPKEDLKKFKVKKVSTDSLRKFGFESLDEYNAFRYTDFSFETFIEAAKKESYFDNTIFVFVGDHGIRGDAGNILPKAFTTQGLTNMHIPLLFYAPKIITPAMYNFPATQMDVLPSITQFVNVNANNTTLGRNLFLQPHAQNNYAFIFDEMNKIVGVLDDSVYYNYNLKNETIENLESVINNDVVNDDAKKKKMKFITNAFYETSRYMLLNNKKKY